MPLTVWDLQASTDEVFFIIEEEFEWKVTGFRSDILQNAVDR